jgi:hypothetical protein
MAESKSFEVLVLIIQLQGLMVQPRVLLTNLLTHF